MKKLVFFTGMAVGYVLGARAGRKRYEQIRSAAQKVWETDPVQRTVAQAEDFAKDRVGDVADAVYSGAKKVVSSVVSNRSSQSHAHESANTPDATFTTTKSADTATSSSS